MRRKMPPTIRARPTMPPITAPTNTPVDGPLLPLPLPPFPLPVPSFAFSLVPVGGGPLLVESVDAPDEMGVDVGVEEVASRDSTSTVSCVADGLADSKDVYVSFILPFPTWATGSGPDAQQMLTCPFFLVHTSLYTSSVQSVLLTTFALTSLLTSRLYNRIDSRRRHN
jgi:hypothetical protein